MGILVSGGAGFIGSHMALELLDAGEDVVVLDNLSTGFRWTVPDAAQFVEGDVGDAALLRRLLAANAIDAIIISPDRSSCPSRSPIRSATISTTPVNRGR